VEVRVFSTAPTLFAEPANFDPEIKERRMTRTLLGAAVLAITLSAGASAQSVGGKYLANGTNFDGSAYEGTALITRSSNSTCRIHWQTGSTSSDGFCMLANDSLAAAYKLGDSVGLVLYELQPDGSLKGVWTIADKSGAGTETLTPAK
jgi:hypothetical protein